jgi:hypothetical protein
MHLRNGILLKATFLIATFLIGIGVSYAWRHYGPIIATQVTYACGAKGSTRSYELLASPRVVTRCYQYSSVAEMNQALRLKLDGTELIERRWSSDTQELIVATQSGYLLLSIKGNIFCWTEGPTIRHLRWAWNP